MGSSGIGAAVGGGLGALGMIDKTRKVIGQGYPGFMAKQYGRMTNPKGITLERALLGGARALAPDSEMERTPRSTIIEGLTQSEPVNLPNMIVNTKLPRDADKILGNTSQTHPNTLSLIHI